MLLPSAQWYPEVRPRLVEAAAHWAALAWCTRASQVQVQRYGAQPSKWPSTPVPDRLLPLTLCSHISAASHIRQSTTSIHTMLPVEFFCKTSFFCYRPISLKLIARVSERPHRRQKQCLPCDAMLSVVYAIVMCLSACLCVCVCHTPVLYQNG